MAKIKKTAGQIEAEKINDRFATTLAKIKKHKKGVKEESAAEDRLVTQRKVAREQLRKYIRAADELANSGLRGYQEWITSVMEIVNTNRELGRAIKAYNPMMWHSVKSIFNNYIAPMTTTPVGNFLWTNTTKPWLQAHGVLAKDSVGLAIPELHYQFEMKPDGTIVDPKGMINGVGLKEYYDSENDALKAMGHEKKANELVGDFNAHLKIGLFAWLQTNGYQADAAANGEITVTPIDPTTTQAFSPAVFEQLNATAGQSLDDYLSGRYENNLKFHIDPPRIK